MTRATPLAVFRNADAPSKPGEAAIGRLADLSREFLPDISFVFHQSFENIEAEWRRFEQVADCTAFQSFDWLATWHRHIGTAGGVVPIIAIGSFANGEIALIAPLAIERDHAIRRLCWLGQDQSDYNAPLLSPYFSQRISLERFLAAWQGLRKQIQRDPRLRYDWIDFEKMPRIIGTQINPFTYLPVTANPSGAHLAHLSGDWEEFYFAKRSSATRRHDRAKRRHISESGEIRFVTSTNPEESRQTLETLFKQKSRAFDQRGIPDIFQRPGFEAFLIDLASNTTLRDMVHVSRVEVGDKLVAANFAMIFGDCYYHVLASYDDAPPISHYGPGALHLRELLAYAIGRRLQRFDFTIGDEPYKLEWCDFSLELFDYSAAATWRGLPVNLSSLAHRKIKRFIKQTPAAWRLASHVRSTIKALKRGGIAHTRKSPRTTARP